MFKKIMLGMLVIMAIAMFACGNGVDLSKDKAEGAKNGVALVSDITAELSEYKTEVKKRFSAYAERYGQDFYSEENWKTIEEIVKQVENDINSAKDIASIDKIFAESVNAISNIKQEVSENLAKKIKQDFINDYFLVYYGSYHNETNPGITVTVDDVELNVLGVFEGTVVAIFKCKYFPSRFLRNSAPITIIYEDMEFLISTIPPLLCWNNGELGSIFSMYEEGYLTKQNLRTIQSFMSK